MWEFVKVDKQEVRYFCGRKDESRHVIIALERLHTEIHGQQEVVTREDDYISNACRHGSSTCTTMFTTSDSPTTPSGIAQAFVLTPLSFSCAALELDGAAVEVVSVVTICPLSRVVVMMVVKTFPDVEDAASEGVEADVADVTALVVSEVTSADGVVDVVCASVVVVVTESRGGAVLVLPVVVLLPPPCPGGGLAVVVELPPDGSSPPPVLEPPLPVFVGVVLVLDDSLGPSVESDADGGGFVAVAFAWRLVKVCSRGGR